MPMCLDLINIPPPLLLVCHGVALVIHFDKSASIDRSSEDPVTTPDNFRVISRSRECSSTSSDSNVKR
ncbi:hypothetical protein M8J76_013154 [Diaphorina citri]|nr:hypothetical protein M8J76_013154 [Diaphorina citri]